MRRLFYLLLLICEFSFAQESTDIRRTLRLDDDDDCFLSKMAFMPDTVSGFHWENQDIKTLESERYWLNRVKKQFKSQTRYTQSIEDYNCVEVAAIKDGDPDLGTVVFVTIYEFIFDYDFQIKNILKAVKKYKVKSLDWFAISEEARFYKSDRSLFLFLNDPGGESKPGFKKLTDKFIEALEHR